MSELVTTYELLATLKLSRSTFTNYRKAGLEPDGLSTEGAGRKSMLWDVERVRQWMSDNGKTGKRGEPPAWAKARTKTVSRPEGEGSVKNGHSDSPILASELWAEARTVEDPLKKAQTAKTIAQAERERMKAEHDRKRFADLDVVKDRLLAFAAHIRRAGEQLEREYGSGANEILQEGLSAAIKEVEELMP